MKYHATEAHAQYRFMVALREGSHMEHFNNLFPLLAPDCILDSSWLSVHEVGNIAIKAFLDDSLEDRWQRNITWNYGVAEILATPEGSEGKGLFGLHIRRETNEPYNNILITAAMDDQGKAKQIWIEDARSYRFRVFQRCVCIVDRASGTAGFPTPFLMPEPFLEYLQLGLTRVLGEHFISRRAPFSLQQFQDALSFWYTVCLAESYDIAFEELAGLNYRTGHCQFPGIAAVLGRQGKHLWENRHETRTMCIELSEWADSDERSTALQFLPPEDEMVLHLTGGNV